jgi:hypothetical protein
MRPELTQEQIDAVEARAYVDPATVKAALARVPPSWTMCGVWETNGGIFTRGSLQVIYSVSRYDDGEIWVHASVCGRTPRGGFYLPSFDELKRVKRDFIGEDRWAYQVFPSAKDYVNENPYVLHLYARMGGEPALPDFTWGLGGI